MGLLGGVDYVTVVGRAGGRDDQDDQYGPEHVWLHFVVPFYFVENGPFIPSTRRRTPGAIPQGHPIRVHLDSAPGTLHLGAYPPLQRVRVLAVRRQGVLANENGKIPAC